MKFSALKTVVTSKVGRQLLAVQKQSPTILFAAGIVSVVGTVVLASKATLKVESVLDEHNETLEKIKTVETADYTEDDRKQDTVVLYIQTAGKFCKLYAPAVVTGIIGVACLTGSHYILTQRNAGLMAAYTALDKGFRAYRNRVREDLGEEKDREYRHGVQKGEYVEVDEETGKEVSRTPVTRVAGEPSIYAKLWGQDYSQSWNRQPDYNLVFLRSQQNYLNDLLKARGHVFLNEAYDQLGLPHTKEGAVVGWVLDNKNGGDNYVDFGLFNREMEPQHFDFFTGREDAIWLDFNVDGVIYDLI
jgi:hypothetical protein